MDRTKVNAALVAALVAALAVLLASFALPRESEAQSNPNVKPNPGRFTVVCDKRWEGTRDPIMFYGKPSAHSHVGAGGYVDYTSSRDTLLRHNTTCTVNADRSGYWVPEASIEGVEVDPIHINNYYGAGPDVDPQSIVLPPVGFEALAGSAAANGPQDPVIYRCSKDARGLESPTPHDCAPDEVPTMRFSFPDCSDGRARSEDHYSHTAYSESGRCPEGFHPILQLTMAVRYPKGTPNFSQLRLSSAHGDAHGDAGGGVHNAHADWLEGWVRRDMQRLTNGCVKTAPGCGILMSETLGNRG